MKTGLNILRISVTALRQLMSHVNILNTMEVGGSERGEVCQLEEEISPTQPGVSCLYRLTQRPHRELQDAQVFGMD